MTTTRYKQSTILSVVMCVLLGCISYYRTSKYTCLPPEDVILVKNDRRSKLTCEDHVDYLINWSKITYPGIQSYKNVKAGASRCLSVATGLVHAKFLLASAELFSFDTMHDELTLSGFVLNETFNRSEADTAVVKNRTPIVITSTQTKTTMPERKMVIVLAYMHTGSTYLGSIFQNHEHTFYEFENLRSLMYSTRAGKMIYFLNGTEMRLHPNVDVEKVHHNINSDVGTDAVRKMITCNHGDLDIATLANHYFPINDSLNRDLQPFFRWQQELYGKSTRLRSISALKYVDNKMLWNTSRAKKVVRSCLPLLTEKCKKSKIVVEKFIRMTMEMAKKLLESFSNLKIIHLFRDPRAMLDSQVRKKDSGAQKLSSFNGRAKYMCQQMAEDYKLAKELGKKFHGQIYTLRYEDMVDFSEEAIKNVFNFIEVPFTKRDELYVKSHSSRQNTVNDSIPLSSWRKHINVQYLGVVDKYCSSLYKEFGYLKFRNYSAIKDPKQKDHV